MGAGLPPLDWSKASWVMPTFRLAILTLVQEAKQSSTAWCLMFLWWLVENNLNTDSILVSVYKYNQIYIFIYYIYIYIYLLLNSVSEHENEDVSLHIVWVESCRWAFPTARRPRRRGPSWPIRPEGSGPRLGRSPEKKGGKPMRHTKFHDFLRKSDWV